MTKEKDESFLETPTSKNYSEDEIQSAVALYRNNLNAAPGQAQMPDFEMLDSSAQDFVPNGAPMNRPVYAPVAKPGFIENFAESFKKTSSIYNIASSIAEGIESENPNSQDYPTDWTPYNLDLINDLKPSYMSYVLQATSPQDQDKRRQWALKQMERDEYFSNGSMLSSMLGGFAGGFASPEFFIPMAQFVKYQQLAPNVYKNLMRSMPTLGASTVLYNAQDQMFKRGGSVEDFLVNTGIDIMAGTFLVGGAAGFGRVATGGQLFAARRGLRMNYDNVGAVYKVDGKGEIKGFAARPASNADVSAAKVSQAQEFLDSQFAKKGMFKVPLITEAVSKVSPIVRMLNSPFGTVRKTMKQFGDFTIETEGDVRGMTRDVSFEQKMKEVNGQAVRFSAIYNGYSAEAKGIVNKSPELIEKSLQTQWQSEFNPANFDFNMEVSLGIVSDQQSSIKTANDAIQYANDVMEHSLFRLQEAKGWEQRSWIPPNAKGYLTSRADTDAIALNLPRWKSVVSREGMKLQERVADLIEPVESAQREITRLKKQISSGVNLERSKLTLKDLEKILQENKDKMVRTIRDDASYHNLLKDRNFLSSEEADELTNLLKPLRDMESELESSRKKIKNLNQKIKRLERKEQTTIKSGKVENQKLNQEIKKQIRPLEKEIEKLKKEKKRLSDSIFTEKNKLTLDAHDGKINPHLYSMIEEGGDVIFHDPNKIPQFEKFKTQEEWEELAENMRWTYEGTSPEQLADQYLHQISGLTPVNPMKKRVFMIPHDVLIAEGFASNDVPKLVSTYVRTLGKRAAFEETTKGFGINKSGIHGIFDSLDAEKRERDAITQKITDDKKRAKQLRKDKKEFSKARKDIERVIDIALGRHVGTPEARRFVNAIRNIQVSTMLGGVPLTQLTDLSGVAYKHGVFALARDFLAPMISDLNGLVKFKNAMARREQAEEALLSGNHLMNGYADKFFNEGTMDKPAIVGKLANGLEKTAHFSGNFFLTNYVENALQRYSANVLQSRIMRGMFNYANGKISPKDMKTLKMYGLDPKRWSDKFINQFEKVGGQKGTFGNYQSDWHLWADVDAANAMARAVNRGVNDIVLKGGLYESPLISKNPYLNLLFSFTGWAFSAFNRYTVPAMQSPDIQKAQGILLGVVLGSLEDPLRKWTRGEDAEILDENWAVKAMGNSGTFALLHSGAMLANALTDRQFLSFMENDRRRGQTLVGMLGGPTLGLTERAYRSVKMIGSGKFNQRDAKQTWNTIPLINAWYLRYLNNTLTETMFGGLPDTPANATGWME